MKAARSFLLGQVSSAHFVSHLHIMTLPALLPLLPQRFGVGFVELGVALGVFNVVSALVQAPLGFAVDRYGARRMLRFALFLGGLAFLSLGLTDSYAWLLVAMGFAGLANGVYHPADYALLSGGIEEGRMGRAFSVHTFAGYLGAAVAPGLLLGVTAVAGTRGAFAVAGAVGILTVFLVGRAAADRSARAGGGADPAAASTPAAAASAASSRRRVPIATLLSPVILLLALLFVLLNLSHLSIQNFSVSALVTGYGVPLATANVALSAYLFASSFGVLAGGALADRTRHHGAVAAIAFGAGALLIFVIALFDVGGALLVGILGLAGFLVGLIAPSRDMLVRAAAPPGAEGRVFGIVSTGFNIGGAIGPVLFGWLLDHGHPRGVFWAAATFMLCTVAITLGQERDRGRSAPAAVAGPAGGGR